MECLDGLMSKYKKYVYGNEVHTVTTVGLLILYSIIDNNMSIDQLILIFGSYHLMNHVINEAS